MNELSLPKVLKHDRNSLHTSSDGSRWTVSRENILSKHSFKYFGLNKGININTHVDERHLPFYSKVISTSEREAASVLDGLLHNDHIRSEIHSTDTHGYTEALFAIMNLLGFKFAPRIKSIKDQRLYSFDSPKEHKLNRDVIVPHRMINSGLISEYFDEILRIAATIGTKYTEASQIFKRLNSYSNENPLYRAVKELGKVYKSIFIFGKRLKSNLIKQKKLRDFPKRSALEIIRS
jgi:TnpA family transposase